MIPSTVLVTGASSGLGRGLALHYARAGATVHALARREPALRALAAEAGESAGRIVPVVVDVADAEALVAAIDQAHRDAGGALDLVIANAGIGDPTPAWRIDWRVVKRILDVNVSSACVTIAAALPAMVQRGQGTVVAIASLSAFRGFPRMAAYCGSKAALHVFMESIRVDLAGTGVRALTVYPGFLKTESTAKNKFPMPFLMELEPAVRTITQGIERGAPVIAFPLPTRLMVAAVGYVPRALYEFAASWQRKPKKRS